MSVREYSVNLFKNDDFGIGVDCGVDFEAAFDNPDPVGPHAVLMEAWSLIDGSFAELAAYYDDSMSVAPVADAAIGGQLASTCVDGGSQSVCLFLWNRGDLVITLALLGPGVNLEQTKTLLFSIFPTVVENLGALGQSVPTSVPVTVATVPPTIAPTLPPTVPPTIAPPLPPTVPPTVATIPPTVVPVSTVPPLLPTVTTVPTASTIAPIPTAPTTAPVGYNTIAAKAGLARYFASAPIDTFSDVAPCPVGGGQILAAAMAARELVVETDQYWVSTIALEPVAPQAPQMFCRMAVENASVPRGSVYAFDITGITTFDAVLASNGGHPIAADLASLGGELGGNCYEFEGRFSCWAMWHRDGLVIDVYVTGVLGTFDEATVSSITVELVPTFVANLGAFTP